MERPARFEGHRWLGDKRTQIVYDLDTCADAALIDELVASEHALCFAPDTLAEARNRGYRTRRPLRRPRPAGIRAESDGATSASAHSPVGSNLAAPSA